MTNDKKGRGRFLIGNLSFEICHSRSGQSLIEVVIGLAIGSILIGAAAFAISTMLQTNLAAQKGQAAAALAQELLNKAKAYGSANWQNLYGLSKSSSTQYFLNASGTAYFVVQGKEGVLDNDVTSGIFGQWKFDEDAASTSTITYDASGNGNYGTLISNPVRATSTCKLSNCLSFDGTNYVQIGGQTTLGTTNQPYSISLWFKANSVAGGVLLHMAGAANGLGWCLPTMGFTSTGQLSVQNWNNGSVSATAVNVTPTGQWINAVETWDATGGLQLYANGALAAATPMAGYTASGASNYIWPAWGATALGCSTGQITKVNFNGSIDDVRVYNRALSADEVRQLWNSNVFTRYFYVENVCRTSDASSSISGVAPCGGGSGDDPSTQKVTSVVQWVTGAGAGITTLSDYLTRWKNVIFLQNDWSGGPGASGPVTTPGNTFASSSDVNYSKGIRIQGL